jgi:hypothetical protein
MVAARSEVGETPGCMCYAWVWVWVSKCLLCVCWHRLNIGRHLDALLWSALPCQDKAPAMESETTAGQQTLLPHDLDL